jgi:hypothetical protein
VNVTTLYAEWLKEVNIDLTTHSRRTGDTSPHILLKFPAHLISPNLDRETQTMSTIVRHHEMNYARNEQARDRHWTEKEAYPQSHGSQTRQAHDLSTVSPSSLRDTNAGNAIAGGCTQPWNQRTGLVHSPIQRN